MSRLFWYCECCESRLNDQDSFDIDEEEMECEFCGVINTLDEESATSNYKYGYECPNCNGHMRRDTNAFGNNVWICEDCGEQGTEENGNIWM